MNSPKTMVDGKSLNGSQLQTRNVEKRPANWHPHVLLFGTVDQVSRYVFTRKLIPGRWHHMKCPADVARVHDKAGNEVFDVIRLRGWAETIDSQAAWADLRNRLMVATQMPTKARR